MIQCARYRSQVDADVGIGHVGAFQSEMRAPAEWSSSLSPRNDQCLSGKSTCTWHRLLRATVEKGAARRLRFDEPFQRDLGRPVSLAKICRFPSIRIEGYFCAVPFRQEGRIARRHERGTGCGGRESAGAIAIAGRVRLVSDPAACRTNDVSRVRQNRVVPTPVAGAKLAEVFPSPTGFGQTLICKRR